MKTTHKGDSIHDCPVCITTAEKARMPWHTDWRDALSRNEALAREVVRKHQAAMARKAREQAMRNCGLVKVRGSLGGTFWE